MKKNLRTMLWVALLLGVVIVVVHHLKDNPEWRRFSWRDFLGQLTHVRLEYLLASVALHLLCYLIRALRWSEFLRPVKRTSLMNLLSAVLIGFTAINLLGRAAEFSRPVFLARKEKLPLSVTLATVVAERLFDFSLIMIIFLVNLSVFQLAQNTTPSSRVAFQVFSRGAAMALTFMLGLTLMLFLFRLNALRWIDFILTRVRLIPTHFKRRAEGMLHSFVEGLAFIHHPRPLFLSIAYSAALWLVVTASNLMIIRGFEVKFSFSQTIVMVTFAALGALIQLPGVGGGLQAMSLFALVSFLGVSPETASGITLLIWTVGSLPVIVIGLGDLLKEGLSLRALRAATEEEVEATFVETSMKS